MGEFYHTWGSPDSTFELVIEDDGKVAYAYLLMAQKIIGDV